MSSSQGITLLIVLALLFILFRALMILKPRWRSRWGSCLFSLGTFLCACALLFSFWGKPPSNVPAPVPASARIPLMGEADDGNRYSIVTLNARDGSTTWTLSSFYPQSNKGNKDGPYVLYPRIATSTNIIYTVWGTEKGDIFAFVALNKQNRRVLWSVTHQSAVEEPGCDTPLVENNIVASGNGVYVLMQCAKYTNAEHTTQSTIGVIYALRAQNGAALWRKTLDPLFLYGIDEPLAATTHLLLVSSQEATYALQVSDGSIAWQSIGGGNLMVGEDRVYIFGSPRGQSNTRVSSLRLQDGAPCYVPTHGISPSSQGTSCISLSDVVSQPGYTDPIVNALVFSGSTLYLTQDDDAYPYVKTLYAINEPDGTLRWKHSLPQTSSGPTGQHIVIQGNGVYVADGPNLSAYRASDGNPLWQRVINSLSEIDTMTAVDGILFLQQSQLSFREIVFCIVDCEPASGSFALNPTDGSTYWRV